MQSAKNQNNFRQKGRGNRGPEPTVRTLRGEITSTWSKRRPEWPNTMPESDRTETHLEMPPKWIQNLATTSEYLSLRTKTIDKNRPRQPTNTTWIIIRLYWLTRITIPRVNFLKGLLLNQTRPNSAATQYTYDVYGNVITEIDALGNITYNTI